MGKHVGGAECSTDYHVTVRGRQTTEGEVDERHDRVPHTHHYHDRHRRYDVHVLRQLHIIYQLHGDIHHSQQAKPNPHPTLGPYIRPRNSRAQQTLLTLLTLHESRNKARRRRQGMALMGTAAISSGYVSLVFARGRHC